MQKYETNCTFRMLRALSHGSLPHLTCGRNPQCSFGVAWEVNGVQLGNSLRSATLRARGQCPSIRWGAHFDCVPILSSYLILSSHLSLLLFLSFHLTSQFSTSTTGPAMGDRHSAGSDAVPGCSLLNFLRALLHTLLQLILSFEMFFLRAPIFCIPTIDFFFSCCQASSFSLCSATCFLGQATSRGTRRCDWQYKYQERGQIMVTYVNVASTPKLLFARIVCKHLCSFFMPQKGWKQQIRQITAMETVQPHEKLKLSSLFQLWQARFFLQLQVGLH